MSSRLTDPFHMNGSQAVAQNSPPPRMEDKALLTGLGRFCDDLYQPVDLVAGFYRSPVAHARIDSIDLRAARAVPGVVAAFEAHDLDDVIVGTTPSLDSFGRADGSFSVSAVRPALARGRVRFVGEPICLVVAETAAAVADGLGGVTLQCTEMQAVTRVDAPGPPLHDAAPDNVSLIWTAGDAEAVTSALAQAHLLVELDLDIPRMHASPLEPAAARAVFDAEAGRWTLYAPSQGVHVLRRELTEFYLGVPPDRVRVVTPDVGGSFGMRIHALPEHAVLLAAARKIGRPIFWRSDRTESTLVEPHARDHRVSAAMALDASGRILGMRVHTRCAVGAYVHPGSRFTPTAYILLGFSGPYRIPALSFQVTAVYTNTTPTAPFRGAGAPEAAYVVERLLDAGALRLGISAIDIRRRNLLSRADMPYRASSGATLQSGHPLGLLETGVENFAPSTEPVDRRLRGTGIALYAKANGMGRRENAELVLSADGRVTAFVSTQTNGQGHATAYAQIIAALLEIPVERINIMQGDSDAVPLGPGTGASGAICATGTSLRRGAEALLAETRERAAAALEVAVADLRYTSGVFSIIGTDRHVSLVDIAREADGTIAVRASTDDITSFSYGCHICEVAVDTETGAVSLLRYQATDDFGRIVNPAMAAGQLHGGICQGAGQALLERFHYDTGNGQALSATLLDYALPRAADLPSLTTHFVETFNDTNPLGARGAGEAGAVPALAAVVNAVVDALRPYGVLQLHPPLTPYAVWKAITGANPQSARV